MAYKCGCLGQVKQVHDIHRGQRLSREQKQFKFQLFPLIVSNVFAGLSAVKRATAPKGRASIRNWPIPSSKLIALTFITWKANLSFVTSVTLIIKVITPNLTGTLSGLWDSYISYFILLISTEMGAFRWAEGQQDGWADRQTQ